jgi:XTP/dITP diphosphohydrolase
VLATANAGKVREFRDLLAAAGLDAEVLPQSALGVPSPDETGDTFEANALLKARHAARLTGLPAVADDSGLEVDALGGRPGVYSARYAGPSATDADNNVLLLRELAGVDPARRTARYRCAIAFVLHADDPSPIVVDGRWDGRIATLPRGSGGFGYDPLFLAGARPPVDAPDRTAAELPAADKHRVSHRGQAWRALLAALRERGVLLARGGAGDVLTGASVPGAPAASPAPGAVRTR